MDIKKNYESQLQFSRILVNTYELAKELLSGMSHTVRLLKQLTIISLHS